MTDPPADESAQNTQDRRLMEAVAAGDGAARTSVVERLMDRVRRTTGALVRQPCDADDATQLSLLEVLRSAHTFRATASLEAWADRITVRTTLRFSKREQKIRQRTLELSRVKLAQAPPSAPSTDALARPVAAYLESLDSPRRTALVLRHVLGYSIDEIADLTDVSRNTVKDRLVRARRELRKMVRRDNLIGVPRSDETPPSARTA